MHRRPLSFISAKLINRSTAVRVAGCLLRRDNQQAFVDEATWHRVRRARRWESRRYGGGSACVIAGRRRRAQGCRSLWRDAARETVVRIVDGRPELLHAHDARQHDERDEERVLNEILRVVVVMNRTSRRFIRSRIW